MGGDDGSSLQPPKYLSLFEQLVMMTPKLLIPGVPDVVPAEGNYDRLWGKPYISKGVISKLHIL